MKQRRGYVGRFFRRQRVALALSALAVNILINLSPTASPASMEPVVTCARQPLVSVISGDHRETSLICHFAGRAIELLAAYGLAAEHRIVIEIVDESIDNHGYIAYGSYDSRIDRIMLMSLATVMSALDNPQMYDEPFDEVHYGGAVAHEVAHAVMQHHQQVKPLSPTPQEYLAHVIQLGVLPEDRRRRIIDNAGVAAWESGDTLADAYMALNQTGFAVKSYLHLTGLVDPAAFVQYLMRARWFVTYVP
jgi:hypothetical protein